MNIEQDEKAGTGYKSGDCNHKKIVRQGGRHGGDGIEGICYAPPQSGAQRNGCGNHENLGNPVNAGIGIPEDNVPHSVGKEKPRHQNHQCTDDDRIGVPANSHTSHEVGRNRHDKCGGDGAEEGIYIQLFAKAVNKTHQNTAETGAECIQHIAAEENGKAACSQKAAQ